MKKWQMSLADSTARTLAKRLKWYEKHPGGHPIGLTEDAWIATIRSMREAFELIARDDGTWNWTPEEELKVQRGLDDFRYWFLSLWT